MRFENKVVIITGGGAGMGRATALGFAKEGASVVINDINEENMNETADKIMSAGGTVTTIKGDVTKSESIKAVVDQVLKQYGKIDVLFNYVGGEPGMMSLSPFMEQSETYWRQMIEINLWSTIIFTRAVLDSMIKQNYGKIINTSSIAGRIAGPRMTIYAAVKGGVIAFTKGLAQEVAPYNINVNCICPGPNDTPGSRRIFAGVSEEIKQQMTSIIPLKRLGRPDDVANAVLFLASDESSYITGQTLAVDGGATMV